MSRRGDPYDNAVAENFFSCLKCELVHLKQYPTRAAACADVFAYLEAFYNTVRPHSALGWFPPDRFEALLCASAAACTGLRILKNSFNFFSLFRVHQFGKGSLPN